MEPSPLEISIREESQRAIRAVHDREASEIKALEDAHTEEMEEFMKKTEEETDGRIDQELSRLESISLLERKKESIRAVEGYITGVVDEVVSDIRKDPGYRLFLLDSVRKASELIKSPIEVHLGREDMVLDKEIRDGLQAGGGSREIIIREDGTIRWGGCIVVDFKGGRLIDSTLERVFFRKTPMIRGTVLRMLSDKGLVL